MTLDIRAAGTAALLVTFDTLDEVVAFRAAVAAPAAPGSAAGSGSTAEPVPGLVEVVSGARTLLFRFDPARTDPGRVRADLAQARPLDDLDRATATTEPLLIPVTYDGEDLDDVARTTGRTPDELVAWHTGQAWTSAFCGFAPGFSYLTGAEPSLGLPRRPTARTRVPGGSVALAGEFSAVYPRASPGGWQLIGRTEVAMWSLDRDPPALAPAGTRIRFVDASPA